MTAAEAPGLCRPLFRRAVGSGSGRPDCPGGVTATAWNDACRSDGRVGAKGTGDARDKRPRQNSMVNEAKEFVKKWDETPAIYADAIDNAERDLELLEIRLVDTAYEKLKDNPTSTAYRETLQGLYESMQNNFSSLEAHLELLLNTARQPSVREQCNQDHVECEWHDGPRLSPQRA